MKIVRPKPRAIFALTALAALTAAALKVLTISYNGVIFKYDVTSQAMDIVRGQYQQASKPRLPIDEHSSVTKKVAQNVVSESKAEDGPKSVVRAYPKVVQYRSQLKVEKAEAILLPAPNPLMDGLGQVAVPDLLDKERYKNAVRAQADQKNQVTPAVFRSMVNTTGYPRLYNGRFVPNRRIVHLDLKGAPPKATYFESFFRMISRLGATGILIEWEDMFPYTGELAVCKNGNAYSEAEVLKILGWAKENNLEIIPLVQTFGHLEWVLKHEKFAHLRELDKYAQVICLSNPEATGLVKTIIDQVMSIHRQFENGKFFHIGADEAFQVGLCERCSKAILEKHSGLRDRLMLEHIKAIAQYVKETYGRRVLAWHDMLNNVQLNVLNHSQIAQYVEPVVWAYAERVPEYVRPDVWNKFSQVFPYIWSASAFKGADGPDRFHSNLLHYMRNHLTWGQAMTDEYVKFKEFRGIILTGWQRFDHFAILCELLPVGIPSLALNLQIVQYGGQFPKQAVQDTTKILGCTANINYNSPGIAAFGCQFEGYEIYKQIQLLKQIDDNVRANVLDDNALKGWLHPFNIRHNYSSAWYLDQLQQKIASGLVSYRNIEGRLKQELKKVFFEDAVDEFLMEHLHTKMQQLLDLQTSVTNLARFKTFPARPFKIQLIPGLLEATTTTTKKPSTVKS